jgi:hypothetical protein
MASQARLIGAELILFVGLAAATLRPNLRRYGRSAVRGLVVL